MPLFFGYIIVFFICSTNLYAQVPLSTALSLAPPPSDLSLVYLGNLFGTVEGVISSSGSQIFGKMMGVLNLSILALGSLVIMYTLVVGTLNTAHEGEFLGKHWSSIWLPVRATIGMTLLIPKSSGYCLMQVLVMWLVVQGIGAADKLWDAALDYLATGGKIVQEQFSSDAIVGSQNNNSNPTYNGAVVILTGQVCSYALQKQLESLRNSYLAMANPSDNSEPSGPCAPANLVVGSNMDQFCNNPVPDLLGDLNAITYASVHKGDATWTMNLPYVSDDALLIYRNLRDNHVCGSLTWENIATQNASKFEQTQSTYGLSEAEMQSLESSRSIAIQQMIDFLGTPARAMVDNDPQINKNLNTGDAASAVAFSQYGVTLKDNLEACTNRSDCTNWGGIKDSSQSVLLNGNEMFNALNAYQGVMQPVLNLLTQGSTDEGQFINNAKKKGWFFAGGYYFDIIVLNGSPSSSSMLLDSQSGLNNSSVGLPARCDNNQSINPLCSFLSSDDANRIIDYTHNLITGSTIANTTAHPSVCPGLAYNFSNVFNPQQGYISISNGNFQTLPCSSTTYGYIGNSYFLVTPGQPVTQGPSFQFYGWNPIGFQQPPSPSVPSCDPSLRLPILGKICFGWLFKGFYQIIFILFDWVMQLVLAAMKLIFSILIHPFLLYFFYSLQNAFLFLSDMNHNPIVNLANMGSRLIEIGGNLFMMMLPLAGLAAFPGVGKVIVVLLMLFLPPITAWVGYFFAIGFFTAYYVPIYPFMIFTFGAIAWLMAVIEAMVAAPIIALGIMSPEGEGILGKAETGMMILVNIFLRPSMMIIGYVAGIMLTYISIWIVNYQFDYVAGFLVNPANAGGETAAFKAGINYQWSMFTQIFAYTAYIGIYVSLYITLVQKSFTLIFSLPDKILRWIGSQQEALGQELQHWTDEGKQKVEQMGQAAEKSFGIDKSLMAAQEKLSEKGKGGEQSGSIDSGSGGGG